MSRACLQALMRPACRTRCSYHCRMLGVETLKSRRIRSLMNLHSRQAFWAQR